MKTMKTTPYFAALALATASSLAGAATPALDTALLADGSRLTLDKKGLHWLDAQGKPRASLPMRAKQLDVRPLAGGALAIVLDADTQRTMPVELDLQAGSLRLLAPLPAPTFSVEAVCLYRDAQQLDHVFVIGKAGISEQWLLSGQQRLMVRRLALPPQSELCRVDDASQTLFVSEPGMGVWAYPANAEQGSSRSVVALRAPHGKLAADASAMAIGQGALALLDKKGTVLHRHKLLPADTLPIVMPSAQTEPMTRQGDAADDPAIWRHPADPSKSRVLGTNKKQGLLVYDLQGKQLQLLESGRLNNVDVRQEVAFGSRRFDLAIATQRDDNSIVLYTIDAGGEVREAARFPTDLSEIYGTCLYQPAGGGLEVFVNDKGGAYRQYRINRDAEAFSSALVRSFALASQPEGCVADDRNGRLFFGEERRGVWVMEADAAKPATPKMMLAVGKVLHADVEGMAIYHGTQASYLVVSSQGSNSYVVTDAAPPYRVRGSFRVGINAAQAIDGSSETDGLDVTSANLGGPYAKGMLVVQDGHKRLPDGAQNFKYIPWSAIEQVLGLQ